MNSLIAALIFFSVVAALSLITVAMSFAFNIKPWVACCGLIVVLIIVKIKTGWL